MQRVFRIFSRYIWRLFGFKSKVLRFVWISLINWVLKKKTFQIEKIIQTWNYHYQWQIKFRLLLNTWNKTKKILELISLFLDFYLIFLFAFLLFFYLSCSMYCYVISIMAKRKLLANKSDKSKIEKANIQVYKVTLALFHLSKMCVVIYA